MRCAIRNGATCRLGGVVIVVALLLIAAEQPDGRALEATDIDSRADASASSPAPEPFVARLWDDPGRVSGRNLFWGAGSASRQPKPPFRFREEDTGGTQPKILVTDAKGVEWDVKLGEEVHAEIAANRIVWALGYLVEELYFVKEGRIDGVRDLKRARQHVEDSGRFQNARFKRRNPRMAPEDRSWSFGDNPFIARRELSGLKILMTLINNWDIEGSRNNRVFKVTVPRGRVERWYLVSDLGGTFGKMGGRFSSRSKWDLDDFRAERFRARISDGRLMLDYDGMDHALSAVSVDDARWFAALAGQLSNQQLRSAFRAAGANRVEAEGFSRALAEKIAALRRATAAPDVTAF